MDGLRTGDGPPPSDAGRLRPPLQRSRVFWNTEPLLRNGERKVSDEFSLRPTRDPSARRRKLTPDAKHPSGHPRLRRPKGALCFTRRPPRIRKSVRSSNGDCPRRRHQASQIETADRRRRASLTLAFRSSCETEWILRGQSHPIILSDRTRGFYSCLEFSVFRFLSFKTSAINLCSQ